MSELARLNSKPSPQETTPEKPLFLLPSGLLLAGDEAWPQIHLHLFWDSAGEAEPGAGVAAKGRPGGPAEQSRRKQRPQTHRNRES